MLERCLLPLAVMTSSWTRRAWAQALAAAAVSVAPFSAAQTRVDTSDQDDGELAWGETRGSALLKGAASYRFVYDIPLYGAALQAGFGREARGGANYFLLGTFLGRTRAGLATREAELGYRGEQRDGRFFGGLTLTVATLWFRRETNAHWLGSAGIGGSVLAGAGLARWPGGGLSAEAELKLHGILGADFAWCLGPQLGVAARF